MVKEIKDSAEFDQVLKDAGDKLVIVDFHATWCGPCKHIAPKIQAMSEGEFKDCVFIKVDVDDCEELAAKYKISAMPTFKLIKNGNEVGEIVGASEPKIREAIQKHK